MVVSTTDGNAKEVTTMNSKEQARFNKLYQQHLNNWVQMKLTSLLIAALASPSWGKSNLYTNKKVNLIKQKVSSDTNYPR